METNKAVARMVPGDLVEGYYLISNIQLKKNSAGKSYLAAVITDASGSIGAKLWNYTGKPEETDNGKVAMLRGEVSEFNGALQFIIQRIRMANEHDSYDPTALVPSAPIDPEQTLMDVRGITASIADEDYRVLSQTLLERHLDTFRTIPAAKSVHHAFLNGLLMHTANMLHTADFLSEVYAEVIDRSLLLSGVLLHDFGKEREFSRTQLGLVTDYSVEGELLGHLYLGAREVAQTARELGIPEEKSMLLQHLLLSHHGEPEYGAAVTPRCAEAELLHLIDLIDSRMEIYAEAYDSIPAGQFSQRLFALDRRVYRHR